MTGERTASETWSLMLQRVERERDEARQRVNDLEAALRRIERWPFDVMREAHEDLADIREYVRPALSRPATDEEQRT